MPIIKLLFLIFLISKPGFAGGYDVFGIGIFDIKFDNSATDNAVDFRYERRLDNVLVDIGPEADNFFYLKPLIGIEATSDSAYYIHGGVYLEDNLGKLFTGEDSNYTFTPSFAAGYYDDGDGLNLGYNLQFKTSLEISYEMQNKNRIGVSFSHISNANLGTKNPGAEILSISYQIPY